MDGVEASLRFVHDGKVVFSAPRIRGKFSFAGTVIDEQLVRDAGCDPVTVGNLASARRFQRGGLGFRAHLAASELRRVLNLH
jgi:hypothetical protein